LSIYCPTALASSTTTASKVVEVYRRAKTSKPLVTNWLGDGGVAEGRTIFAREGIATFDTPGSAVRGFMQLVRHARAQDELMRTPPAMPARESPDAARASGIIRAALDAGRSSLSEAEGKALLDCYGIPVVKTLAPDTPEAARMAAEKLLAVHGAVVLKIRSEDISHKSDVGGVRLDLTNAAGVEAAACDMLERIGRSRPAARLQGFTLSPMIRRPLAHELILGMSVDATFGPMIMFGAGGTSVEVVADTSLALPPLDIALARDLVGRTRIARLLAGYRDRKPADIAAIAQTLVRLSALVCAHPEIREIDINPLLADEAGVIALDARLNVADETREPRPPLAVKPYPAQWEKRLALAALGDVLLRPIRPEDEVLYEAFLKRVTPDDLRMRLLAPQKGLSHRFLARLTQIDYAREIAFIAMSTVSGELLGVSRFAADPDFVRAEYAVIVRSDLKGVGLGWQLMQHLIAYARATGIKELFGHVLYENTTMLAMCRELGFSVERDPDDRALRRVTLKLVS